MYHFILNPKASSGKGVKVWEQLKKILDEEKIQYKLHMLESARETTKFVRILTGNQYVISEKESAATTEIHSNQAEECHIVVLGGDGTINAVLNGIEDFQHTILSCIRTGSGNDFARNVGVRKDAVKAFQHLLSEPDKLYLDYGETTYKGAQGTVKRRFAISTGVGYDADICEEVGRSRLKKALNRVGLGKLVYVLIGIKQIFTRKNPSAIIYMDGEKLSIPYMFFVVGMIHEKEGGGVPFCPNADATDGFLDVCLVRGMSKLKLLLAVAMVYMKQHYRFSDITAHRCKQLSVTLNEPQWFHTDGETNKQLTEISIVCKSGLRFYK